MDHVNDAGIFLCHLEMQEESVKPRGVVVRQIEARAPFPEEVFVVLERIRVRRKLLLLRLFHHFAEGIFRIDRLVLDDVPGGVGCLFFEHFRELRIAERRIADLDSVIGVGESHHSKDEEQ